jgi:hypothetical protein
MEHNQNRSARTHVNPDSEFFVHKHISPQAASRGVFDFKQAALYSFPAFIGRKGPHPRHGLQADSIHPA